MKGILLQGSPELKPSGGQRAALSPDKRDHQEGREHMDNFKKTRREQTRTGGPGGTSRQNCPKAGLALNNEK